MERPGHQDISMFVGTEVEHSPAFGQKTLFVVGILDSTKIIIEAQRQACTHIYFGANQSFPCLDVDDGDAWRPWETMITDCLDSAFTCTLDLDVSCAEGLLESSLVEHHNFIPMISVKLPYIRQFGYNATLKIDDKDFRATNPGVWCNDASDGFIPFGIAPK